MTTEVLLTDLRDAAHAGSGITLNPDELEALLDHVGELEGQGHSEAALQAQFMEARGDMLAIGAQGMGIGTALAMADAFGPALQLPGYYLSRGELALRVLAGAYRRAKALADKRKEALLEDAEH